MERQGYASSNQKPKGRMPNGWWLIGQMVAMGQKAYWSIGRMVEMQILEGSKIQNKHDHIHNFAY